MLYAVRYIGSMGKGLTKPQLFECDDGNHYVIKLKENPVGTKVLVNELIANRIGNLLGLPVSLGNLIYIPSQIIKMEPFQEGIHFGTLVSPHILRNPPLKLIERAYNFDCIPGMYVLDNYLTNADRHYENIILCIKYYGNQIALIDHSHCFFSPQWTPPELLSLTNYDNILTRGIYSDIAYLVKGPDPFEGWLTRLESIPEEQLISIVNEIPREWDIVYEDRDALLFYLIHRKRKIRFLFTSAKNQFPNWKEY